MFSLFYGRLPSETDTDQSAGFLKRYLLPHSIILSPQNKCFLIQTNLVRVDRDQSRSGFLFRSNSNLYLLMKMHKQRHQRTNLFPAAQTVCHRGGSDDASTTCVGKLATRWDNMGALIGDQGEARGKGGGRSHLEITHTRVAAGCLKGKGTPGV